MSIPAPPGDLGRRLLPSVVDDIARSNPSRVLYSIPKTRQPRDGFQDITALQFSQAVNRCAWHLRQQLGPAGPGFPTVLYIGPQDIVYAVLVRILPKLSGKMMLNTCPGTGIYQGRVQAIAQLAKEYIGATCPPREGDRLRHNACTSKFPAACYWKDTRDHGYTQSRPPGCCTLAV